MLHNKFWQGFFALAPLIMVFIMLIAHFLFFFSMIENIQEIESSGNASASLILGDMTRFLVLILLVILLSFSSLIFYILHAVQNENLKENDLLIVWMLLFIFVGGIGQLVYWIIEILAKRKAVEPAKTNL